MRNPEGSLQRSPLDTAIFRQVLYSGFISRRQLQECLEIRGFAESKKTIDKRLRQLLEQTYLKKVLVKLAGVEAYCLLSDGEEALRLQGECFSSRGFHRSAKRLRPANDDKPEHKVIDHWLGINDVFLALARKRKLLRWTPEITIRTYSDVEWNAYVKEYDAVITFAEFPHLSLGLEYERTPKKKERYTRIVSQIEHDKKVDAVLYLTPSASLRSILRDRFINARKPVYVGDFAAFQKDLLDTQVSASGIVSLRRPLQEFLRTIEAQKIQRTKALLAKNPPPTK